MSEEELLAAQGGAPKKKKKKKKKPKDDENGNAVTPNVDGEPVKKKKVRGGERTACSLHRSVDEDGIDGVLRGCVLSGCPIEDFAPPKLVIQIARWLR